MKIIHFKSKSLLDSYASQIIIQNVMAKPNLVLGLATGRTMVSLYSQLIRDSLDQNISWNKVITFNLDEYVGLGKLDAASYYSYMQQHLFSHLNFNQENCHLPNGLAQNLSLEGPRYEGEIKNFGPIDLQLLGLGVNGHIGFNEPNSSFDSLTRLVTLADTTRKQNTFAFENGKVPTQAISMGLKTIFKAKKILLLVTGEEKAQALKNSLEVYSEKYPASILLKHPDTTILADIDALELLDEKSFKTVLAGEDLMR